MFHNGTHEICEDFEAAPSFRDDVPFPHHHKRNFLPTDVSKGRKRESKMEEDIEQVSCNTSSCCSFEATVVSTWFCFFFFRYFSTYLG